VSYSFRVRFELGHTAAIESDERQLTLSDTEDERVVIRPARQDAEIKGARELILLGQHYSNPDSAYAAGARWTNYLQVGFARAGIGADFGDDRPDATFSDWALKSASDAAGTPVLGDRHGVLVYPTVSPPVFLAIHASGRAGRHGVDVLQAIEAARQIDAAPTDEERVAFGLYRGLCKTEFEEV
jgi:hypothetical protein